MSTQDHNTPATPFALKATWVSMGAPAAAKAGADAATRAAIAKGYVANRKLVGKVVGLWGEALVRTEAGELHPLKVGDVVKKGDVVLTTQDGIVQIEGHRELPASIERVIAEVSQGRPEVAPAAGAEGDAFQPGLRVDRVVEAVTPASLELTPFQAQTFVIQDEQAQVQLGGATATPDTVTVSEDGSVGFDPRDNDTGTGLVVQTVAGQPITVGTPVTIPQGTITLNADGTLTFTPNPNFSGEVTLPYTVVDTDGNTATSTVTIEVTPVNDAPVATDNSFSVTEDTPVSGNVLNDDSDVDGDALTVTQFSVDTNGDGIPEVFAAGSTATINEIGRAHV